MDPALAPEVAEAALGEAAETCRLDVKWWPSETGGSGGLGLVDVLDDGQAAALHDLLNGDVTESPGVGILTKVSAQRETRQTAQPFDPLAWSANSAWEDWSPVTLPEHFEARLPILPPPGSFDEGEVVGMDGGRWQNAWLWIEGAGPAELPDHIVIAEAPPGVEGVGRWVWAATKTIFRNLPSRIASDLVIRGGVYVTKRVYRWQKAEHIKFQRYHSRQERMQRIALRLQRERQQRLSGPNAARWRAHYSQLDRMIAMNR